MPGLMELDGEEKAGADRKDWGAAGKRIWLTGSCDYRTCESSGRIVVYMQMGNLVVENGHVFLVLCPKDTEAAILEQVICLPLCSVPGLVKGNVYDDLCRAGSKFPFQSNCPDGTGRHRPE